jgi:hypothetical protein
MMKTQITAVLAAGLLAGPMLVQAQYDFEIFDYPGADFTQVFGISDRGDVVGTAVDLDSIPFVYDSKKGTFTDVAPIAGFDSTTVLGISESGVLVGSVFDDDLGTESGLIIHKDGSATVFDHPDAVSFTQARGVNNEGLVTGYRDSAVDQFAPENGFIYDTETDTFTDIVPSIFTIAQGINSRGDVVGHATFDGNFGAPDPCGSSDPFVRRGWLRTTDGTVTYFVVNGGDTSARGITDSGAIAGFIRDSVTKGFVVELDGSQCQSILIADDDLLAIPGVGDTFTFPGGIRNSGEVVGSYDDDDGTHGFIATPQ